MSETNGLPELSDERIARMEAAVLRSVGEEGRAPAAPRARRRRRWTTGIGVAAAFVGGVLVAPPLLNGMVTATAPMSESAPYDVGLADRAADGGGSGAAEDMDVQSTAEQFSADGVAISGETSVSDREIITTSSISLEVRDVPAAAEAIGALAAESGGYVESTDIGLSQRYDASAPRESGSGWIMIRIPASEVDTVSNALAEHGTILRQSISREDVTATAVDLRARIDSGRASVERLTELMSQSGSVADLISAEQALSERQAQLESLEQQLKYLDEQVAMSTLTVSLSEQGTVTPAEPAGFGDGLLAGWNGLIVALNALVIAVGFLLPWLAVAGIVILILWLVLRRRRPRTTEDAS